MKEFLVEIVIEGKTAARDPEGETIEKYLVSRGGYSSIKDIRTGKFYKMKVQAENIEKTRTLVSKMVNDLRIFNPVVHTFRILSIRE